MEKISFLRVVLDLFNRQKTGVLKIKKDQLEKSIFFKAGNIIFIDSSIRSENLGRILVENGKLTEEQFEKVVNRVKETGRRQGEVLVELGFLTPFDVFEALKDQLVKKLLNCFLLRDFEYRFEEGAKHLENITEIPITLKRVIVDGVQASYTLEVLKEEITFDRDMVPLISLDAKAALNQIQLRPDELKLTRAINGRDSLFNIAKRSNLDHQFVLSTVFVLHELGIISYTTPPPKKEPAPKKVVIKPKGPSTAAKQQEKGKEPLSASEKQVPPEKPALLTEEPAPPPLTESQQDKGKEPKKESPLYALYIKVDTQGYPEFFGLSIKFKKDDLKRNYEELLRKYSLDRIEQVYSGDEKEIAERLLNKLVGAFTILKDEKKKELYLKERGQHRQTKVFEGDKLLQAEVEATKGAMYKRKNNIEKAAHAYKKAMDLNPQEIEYCVNFAELLMTYATEKKAEIPKQVEETLKKALSIDQNNFNVLLNLGIYYKMIDDRQKAISYFTRTVAINRSNQRANAELRLLNIRGEKKSLFSIFSKKGEKAEDKKKKSKDEAAQEEDGNEG